MLRQLYNLTTPWGTATPWQLFKNRMLGRLINYIYPPFIALRPIKKRTKNTEPPRIIVTLTTFPNRAEKAHLCLNSILRQKRKADEVVIYLAKDEFPTPESVPEKIRDLQKKGFVDIRFCHNLRSYKKIFYAAQDFTNDIIITADDDSFYPENWIEDLIALSEQYPNCVCCYRACEIKLDENYIPMSYVNYPKLSTGVKGPSYLLIPTGVGGVLYPPGAFSGVDFDEKAIEELCPNADDVWLRAVMMKKGLPAVKVRENSTEWFTVLGSQRWSIKDENITQDGPNDIAMKNLVKAFDLDFKPFAAGE